MNNPKPYHAPNSINNLKHQNNSYFHPKSMVKTQININKNPKKQAQVTQFEFEKSRDGGDVCWF